DVYLGFLGPLYVGAAQGSNTVIVTGACFLWNNPDSMSFGYWGADNYCFVLSDGGRVNDVNFYNGYVFAAGSNSITVSGAGSVWKIGRASCRERVESWKTVAIAKEERGEAAAVTIG